MLSGLSNTINSENTVYASPKSSTVPQHCMKKPVRFINISQSILASDYLYADYYNHSTNKRKSRSAKFLIPMPSVQLILCVLVSHVRLFETTWTAAHQASLSIKLAQQEYWSG